MRWYGGKETQKDELFDLEKSPLYNYIDDPEAMKTCPALKEMMEPKELSKVWGYEKGGFGYGYNELLGSLRLFSSVNFWEEGCQKLGIEKEKVTSPETTLMFIDTATRLNVDGERVSDGFLAEFAYARSYNFINATLVQPWGTPIPSSHFRHSKMANVAWCDGHVSKENQTYSKGRWGKSGIGFFGEKDNKFFEPVK
jgi:prepilin-type processing-associated H-X9-DG protein